ncbi:MAG: NfeD family protein [Methylacidiphilaceae bacterium]|nr:NfeD family protein [Candidatus Methylacidiphilaceae bacterium]
MRSGAGLSLSWKLFGILAFLAQASASQAGNLIYVIPVHGEIEPALVYLVRRGVKEAVSQGAAALVLDLDTPGGRADAMEEMIRILEHFPNQQATYSFVDPKAFSAGAFVAAATRHIYMAPGSVIGAATPVLASPGGGSVQNIPESYEKKILSAYQALVRATAQRHGHNPAVFEAMVDRESGLVIEGALLLPKGKVLTLTDTEAARRYGHPPEPLLSEGSVADLRSLALQIGGPGARVQELRPTGFEQLARALMAAGPLLLGLGLLLGYLEIKTGGSFGLFGGGALLFFLLYFFGYYLAGLSGWEPLFLFLAGIGLIVLEFLFLPGLLLPTMVGLILVVMGLLFAMVDRYPTEAVWIGAERLAQPLLSLTLSALGAFALGAIAARFLPTRRLSLGPEGISAEKMVPRVRPGEEGVALTVLRPAGTARFGEKLVDVVTSGAFVPAGSRLRIVSTEGVRVVVEALDEER